MASTAPTAPPASAAMRDRLLADARPAGPCVHRGLDRPRSTPGPGRAGSSASWPNGAASPRSGRCPSSPSAATDAVTSSPYSDLDLLLLAPGADAPLDGLADATWYPIWDDGLKLGHSLRTSEEAIDLAAVDRDTATSLLTVRHLAGDARLTADVADEALRRGRALGQAVPGVAARRRRRATTAQDEVAFLLEPDLKEGRGGLRDMHSLRVGAAARPVLEPGDAERADRGRATSSSPSGSSCTAPPAGPATSSRCSPRTRIAPGPRAGRRRADGRRRRRRPHRVVDGRRDVGPRRPGPGLVAQPARVAQPRARRPGS